MRDTAAPGRHLHGDLAVCVFAAITTRKPLLSLRFLDLFL
jgi:hypothetical protein